MVATDPRGETWLGTIAKFTWFCMMYICAKFHAFSHKMHDSIIFGQLAVGLKAKI